MTSFGAVKRFLANRGLTVAVLISVGWTAWTLTVPWQASIGRDGAATNVENYGQWLSGALLPLTVAWAIAAFFLQRRELIESRMVFRDQAEQQRQLAEATTLQTERQAELIAATREQVQRQTELIEVQKIANRTAERAFLAENLSKYHALIEHYARGAASRHFGTAGSLHVATGEFDNLARWYEMEKEGAEEALGRFAVDNDWFLLKSLLRDLMETAKRADLSAHISPEVGRLIGTVMRLDEYVKRVSEARNTSRSELREDTDAQPI